MTDKLGFKDFDEDIHIRPDNELIIDPDWPKYRSLDFGFVEPFVCLYLTINPERQIILYDEYYYSGRIVEENAKALSEKVGKFEYTTCARFSPSERALLLEYGIPTLSVMVDILHGIASIRSLLKDQIDDQARFIIGDRCVGTIEEFATLSNTKLLHGIAALMYFIVNLERNYARSKKNEKSKETQNKTTKLLQKTES